MTAADEPSFAGRYLALGVYLSVCACELATILLLNHGQFLFSLDDPYIHLALAENIVRGTYGVNLGEFSAPSSSALWPFLLVPGEWLHLGPWPALLINCAAGAASVWLLQRIVGDALGRVRPVRAAQVALVLALCADLAGLAFTGMEHSLHALCSLAVLDGAICQARGRAVPWWAWIALCAGPWLRYEGLAVTGVFALLLFHAGQRRAVVAASVASALGLTGFTWFLARHHVALLPTSVLAKGFSTPWSGLYTLLEITRAIMQEPIAVLFVVSGIALVALAIASPLAAARRIALAMCAVTLAHLGLGAFGAYSRHETYLWALDTATIAWLGLPQLYALRDARLRRQLASVCVAALLIFSMRPLYRMLTTPLGARDMLRQQLQLHRIAAELYRKPVAVNDLGLVSYRNDHYVLDLRGLANAEALQHRLEGSDARWMDELAQRHGVGLAMIYRTWFEALPATWIELGRLRIPHATTAASLEVSFFATSTAAARELKPLLGRFTDALPAGAAFERAE